MKLEEAIKELQEEVDSCIGSTMFNLCNAMMLGIEALKQLRLDRTNRLPFQAVLLPGETED